MSRLTRPRRVRRWIISLKDNQKMEETLAWHLTGSKLRDGSPIPPVGEWLRHDGEMEICRSGLHASERLTDALEYAPGNTLHRVTVRGDIKRQHDKLVGRERRIEWSVDAEPVLRAFARRAALDVAHLWNMPPVVREYLETGDDGIRAAARAAAVDAVRAAARDAARDAARAAAVAAAGFVARDAARVAARDAVRAATRDAMRAAEWSAAWDADWSAAWSSAWAAARAKQDASLVEMIEAARVAP